MLPELAHPIRSGQAASLSTEQLDNILPECAPKLRAAHSICKFTACRISECLAFRCENVMTDSIMFPHHITKNNMATNNAKTTASADSMESRVACGVQAGSRQI